MTFIILGGMPPRDDSPQGRINRLFVNLDTVEIQRALDDGIDINCPHSSGHTLIMSASAKKNLDLVKFLVAQGADITKTDRAGRNAIMYMGLCQSYSSRTVEYLLNNGIDINAQDKDGKTALMFFSEGHMWGNRGNLQAVKYLIKRGADSSMTSNAGKTAYDYAEKANNRSQTSANQGIVEVLAEINERAR